MSDIIAEMSQYYDLVVLLIPKLLVTILFLFFLRLVSKRIKKSILNNLEKAGNDRLATSFIGKFINAIVVLISILLLLNALGMGGLATGIMSTAGVGAFIIGFASKDIGEHFLAGFILALNKPFRIGDLVELGGKKGQVESLNIRTTHVKTFDGQDVYIPNGNIIKNNLINYTIDGFIRKEFDVGIDYNANIKDIIHAIKEETTKVPGLLTNDKQPSVAIKNLDKNTLILTIYYWLNTFDDSVSPTDVHINVVSSIIKLLNEKGVYLLADVIALKNYSSPDSIINKAS